MVKIKKCAICKTAPGRRTVDGKPNCTRPKCYAKAVKDYLTRKETRP